jgi:hypothetical protein
VRRQHLCDSALQRFEQLALFGRGVGLEASTREEAPAFGLERHLAPLPGTFPQLHGRLQEGELVGPGGEAAGAAEVVEAPKDAHERVVGGFRCDVFELVGAQMRERRPEPGDFKAGGAQEQRVQPCDRVFADRIFRG